MFLHQMAGRKKTDKEAGSETDEAEVETKVSRETFHQVLHLGVGGLYSAEEAF